MQPCPTCGGMGIDANGYCTQCRTYRGVPQAPQPPVSGSPYGGDPYSGAPYAGYQSSGPSFPDQQVSGPAYPAPTSGPSYGGQGGYPGQVSGPGYAGQVSGPPAYPPTTYGGQYGASPTPPKKNRFLTPILALSGVVIVLVIAIVVVVALKNKSADTTDLKANPGRTTAGASAKPTAAIDTCLIGTWQTTSYTETAPMDNVEGGVKLTLDKNGSKIKFTDQGAYTETYENSVYKANPTISGQAVAISVTVNATVTATVHTTSGSIVFSDTQATGKMLTNAPSIGFSQEDAFTADGNPAKYTCSSDTLSFSTSTIQVSAKKV